LGMALDEPKDSDQSLKVKGVSFIYDKNDEGFMNDSIIDFQETFSSKGFIIRAASSGCSC